MLTMIGKLGIHLNPICQPSKIYVIQNWTVSQKNILELRAFR